jgi:hypothetical protein
VHNVSLFVSLSLNFNFAEYLVMVFFFFATKMHFTLFKKHILPSFSHFFFLLQKLVKIHHKRKHYLCNTKILRAKNTDLQTTSSVIFSDEFCCFCQQKIWEIIVFLE